MILMAKSLKGAFTNQLGFRDESSRIIHTPTMMPIYALEKVPKIVIDIAINAAQFKLEGKAKTKLS